MGVVVIGGGGSGGGGGGNPGGQKVEAMDDGRLMQGEEVVGMFDDPEVGRSYAAMLNAQCPHSARFIPYSDGLTPESLAAADDTRA